MTGAGNVGQGGGHQYADSERRLRRLRGRRGGRSGNCEFHSRRPSSRGRSSSAARWCADRHGGPLTMNGTFRGGTDRPTNAAGNQPASIGRRQELTVNGPSSRLQPRNRPAPQPPRRTDLNGGRFARRHGPTSQVTFGRLPDDRSSTPRPPTLLIWTAHNDVNLGTVDRAQRRSRRLRADRCGTLLLSNTANTIAARRSQVGSLQWLERAAGHPDAGKRAPNLINADPINSGFSKINGTVAVASQTAGSPGTVTIGNKAGPARGPDIPGRFAIRHRHGGDSAGTLDLRARGPGRPQQRDVSASPTTTPTPARQRRSSRWTPERSPPTPSCSQPHQRRAAPDGHDGQTPRTHEPRGGTFTRLGAREPRSKTTPSPRTTAHATGTSRHGGYL